MKNSKKVFILIEIILGVMFVILALAMIREKDGENKEKISVILQNSDNEQWSAFKYGLRMAAQDQGTEMFVVSTGENMTLEEEKEIIEREIDYGADAVIVQPVPGAGINDMLKKIEKKVPVILIEQTADEKAEKSEFPVIEPDNYAMGKTLAEELLKDYSGDIEGKTIGILSGAARGEAAIRREQGFRDGIIDTGAKISWSISDSSETAGGDSLEAQTKVDIVIALDNSELIKAGKFSAANDLHGALLYGIGSSTEAAYYLDTGVIQCLIVPDAFNTGYQSLTEIVEKLRQHAYKMQEKVISYKVIRQETLFSEENQEILFKMSQ